MKQFLLGIALLVCGISVANAAIYDIANKQYHMIGSIRANIVAHCGVVTLRSPMEFSEEFSIQFSEQVAPLSEGDIVGTFQITDDNLLGEGEVIDGEVARRNKNKLILKYQGLTPLEGAEKLKILIRDKALEHQVDFGAEMTVKTYSFTSYVHKDWLKFIEAVNISIPNYPKFGCKANLKVKRKLLGLVVIPVV